ncbi:cytochrome P450 [Streptomyces clavuligerus]|nr:cytochrome P450 [Streptomyces clavuligerus]ANW16918.1 cytochrome [Streptomyces clavuligerus]AXU11447.1 cytochrome P450 [Streptomyces clavuligerus]EDY50782.1 cytochrome P-450 [Streptomyces clavuligerus]MBY6301265.1 cytochrome P450 [Streptomyces clavuligerus]QCS04319.1 cytochrome P450 [Streptomyces clavuligerus]
MSTGSSAHYCPFDYAEALEFDPTLRRFMREEPVARIRLPHGAGEAWLVTGYDDVRTVTTDRRFSRHAVVGRDFPRMTPEPIVQDEAINVMDPPASSRLRSLVSKGFAPEQIERMRPYIQRAVDDLLDRMAEDSSADLMRHLAGPLPLITICEVLEIPPADQETLRGHARTMMNISVDNKAAAVRAKADLRAYFADLTARRRADPGEDLISVLATARDGDELLDDQELTVMAMVLLITGQDTTTYELGNLSYTLLTRPDVRDLLRDRPERLAQTINELLRFIPFRKGVGIPRVATEDVELSGVTIPAGDIVHVSYLTANRDGRKFDRPDELDFDRTAPSHMTFGWGAHHCLGAPLAQAEMETAFRTLLERFPGIALAKPAEDVEWNTTSIWRYPLALPVTW